MRPIKGCRGSVISLLTVSIILSFWLSSAGQAQEPLEAPPRIVVQQVVVEGNTYLSAGYLAWFQKQYVGKRMRLDDIQDMADALQKKYRDEGYVTTRVVIPTQTLTEGTVTLKVIEGKIGQVTYTGNEYFSARRNYVPYLPSPGEPFNRYRLNASLKVINSHPDKQVTVHAVEGQKLGETDLKVRIEEKRPWHIKAEAHNSGTEQTEYWRTIVTAQYDNFFDRSQVGVIQYATSPEDFDAVRQYAASYYIPIGPTGLQDKLPWDASDSAKDRVARSWVTFYGGYSDTNVDNILNILRLEGEGTIIGGAYTMPLPTFWQVENNFSIGLEWQAVKDTIAFGQAKFTDSIRKLPLTLRWQGSRKGKKSTTNFSAGMRYQTNDPWMSFDDDEYDRVREGASTSWWVLLFGVQRMQKLPRDWSLMLSAEAQMTEDRLLPSEQYFLGGYDSVRGYKRRTLIADTAMVFRSELRTPLLEEFTGGKLFPEEWDERLQLLAFLDFARAENTDAAPSELDTDDLMGLGVGARATFLEAALQMRLDVGWAIIDPEATESVEDGHTRAHFGISYTY